MKINMSCFINSMARTRKDPSEPKAVMSEQQKAQLDKARAAGAKKRQENAILKKAAKKDEKDLKNKEREEQLQLAKDKLDGKVKIEEEVDKSQKNPEQNNIKKELTPTIPEKPVEEKIVKPVEKPIEKIVEKPVEKPKSSKSSKDAYYDYKLKWLQQQKQMEQPAKQEYDPTHDAHRVAQNNLHSHFSKEIMRDMYRINFPHDKIPDKYL